MTVVLDTLACLLNYPQYPHHITEEIIQLPQQDTGSQNYMCLINQENKASEYLVVYCILELTQITAITAKYYLDFMGQIVEFVRDIATLVFLVYPGHLIITSGDL